MTVAALTREPGKRDPSQYDSCPRCGRFKRTRSRLCWWCYKIEPRPRTSTNPNAGSVWARTNLELAPSCENCGKPAVDRHHIDGNQLNNDVSNIASLCRRCHMEADGRIRGWALGRYPTHCKRGHPLSGDNLYTYQDTGRHKCRACAAERCRRYRRERQGR